ncbi:uncharacterized protein BXZ73DRAFT_74038 [Epithele typhae]|uniref:uncharacterized protein n=1 Tax=Epithele typhae TaxID=378194 RepID=UPI00200851EE|nr:uncharacterized protein BXZ73DRAFT_74038 [Epithele typhae]KAH9944549.1 hypothetical protein BXZ73DRAFT_74038 [Epithele typhae]
MSTTLAPFFSTPARRETPLPHARLLEINVQRSTLQPTFDAVLPGHNPILKPAPPSTPSGSGWSEKHIERRARGGRVPRPLAAAFWHCETSKLQASTPVAYVRRAARPRLPPRLCDAPPAHLLRARSPLPPADAAVGRINIVPRVACLMAKYAPRPDLREHKADVTEHLPGFEGSMRWVSLLLGKAQWEDSCGGEVFSPERALDYIPREGAAGGSGRGRGLQTVGNAAHSRGRFAHVRGWAG